MVPVADGVPPGRRYSSQQRVEVPSKAVTIVFGRWIYEIDVNGLVLNCTWMMKTVPQSKKTTCRRVERKTTHKQTWWNDQWMEKLEKYIYISYIGCHCRVRIYVPGMCIWLQHCNLIFQNINIISHMSCPSRVSINSSTLQLEYISRNSYYTQLISSTPTSIMLYV